MIAEGLADLGFRMEDVVSQEHDAALGNGGLGRLAACFLDSMASLNIPAWGYGLRYRYGIFKQEIVDGYQVEVPDYWLDFNPWEFQRHDITVDIQFYGHVNRWQDDDGKQQSSWEGGEIVQAVAYDVPVPGYKTGTCNNLRLWGSKAASGEFDFQKFNSGEYESSVADQQRAETISAVLYPNDNLERGKELRLKQQYFWCAASLYDIVRRFKKSKRAWKEFPNQVAIQLNDTHPTLAIPELQRILVDIEGLDWDDAWNSRSSGGIQTCTRLTSSSCPEDFRLHQPHSPSRSAREVVCSSHAAPSSSPPPGKLGIMDIIYEMANAVSDNL